MPGRASPILAFALLPLAGCSDFCANEIVQTVPAPDGKMAAVLFERNCGATSDFTTQVSIVRRGEAPDGRGNIYIADADDDPATRGQWGGPWAELRWAAPDRLHIGYVRHSRIFHQERRRGGVEISYEAIDLGR